MATTREDHSPSTRDRARVVERERDSGEGRYERGDASGPHQRREGEKSLVMMSTANEVMGGGREQSVLHFGTALIRDFVVCRRCSPSANLT